LKDPIATNKPTPSSTGKTGAEAVASLYDAMDIESNPTTGNSEISPSLQRDVSGYTNWYTDSLSLIGGKGTQVVSTPFA
jgi:hypothetical protein